MWAMLLSPYCIKLIVYFIWNRTISTIVVETPILDFIKYGHLSYCDTGGNEPWLMITQCHTFIWMYQTTAWTIANLLLVTAKFQSKIIFMEFKSRFHTCQRNLSTFVDFVCTISAILCYGKPCWGCVTTLLLQVTSASLLWLICCI